MKTIDDSFSDWESHVFGLGYGTGEPHILLALKQFLALCPDSGPYSHETLEKTVGPTVTWLLITTLVRADIIEYGTSPRFGWLTVTGQALKAYVGSKTTEELVELVFRDPEYAHCYPDGCNCGPNGYEEGRRCPNPFWRTSPPLERAFQKQPEAGIVDAALRKLGDDNR